MQGIAGVIGEAFTGVIGRERYFEWLPGRRDSRFGRCWKWIRHGSSGGYYGKAFPYDAFSFSAMNQMRKYGDDWLQTTFGELAIRRLRAWGINTVGNWSDERVMLRGRVPYTDTFSTKARSIAGCSGNVANFPDVFAPEFAENVDRAAARRTAVTGSDPWCIGWFVDNELHWGSDDEQLARAVLASPADQPARMAVVRWLGEHGIVDSTNVPSEKLKAVTRLIADRYFETVRAAIKKHAPNRLYLGCRFAWAGEEVWRSAAAHCDVVSVNVYRKTPSRDLPDGADDKPIIVGEFHFGALDRGMFHTGLVATASQKERAECYKAYVRAARQSKRIVGAHWFRWRDQPLTGRADGECFQIGFLDVTDRPYPEMVEAARELAKELYAR